MKQEEGRMKALNKLGDLEKSLVGDVLDYADMADKWAHDLNGVHYNEVQAEMRKVASNMRRGLLWRGVVEVDNPVGKVRSHSASKKPVTKPVKARR